MKRQPLGEDGVIVEVEGGRIWFMIDFEGLCLTAEDARKPAKALEGAAEELEGGEQ